jgi:hypothetical protein
VNERKIQMARNKSSSFHSSWEKNMSANGEKEKKVYMKKKLFWILGIENGEEVPIGICLFPSLLRYMR